MTTPSDNQQENVTSSNSGGGCSPDMAVRVAVRIRPQISREVIDMCQVCTNVTPGEPQVWLGKDTAFTFDHVFNIDSTQTQVYESCVKDLVDGCFSGYNATVLAYGQTGSGKTYTMGTGFEPNAIDDESQGIVPRAVHHMFNEIDRLKTLAEQQNQVKPEFQIRAQFLELYNEDIIDLLSSENHVGSSMNNNNSKQIRIHQENGSILLSGVTSQSLVSADDAFECLKLGALSRTTASTQMNTKSSRSHAIFTLSIQQTRVITDDVETLNAKFHFVDLAGSERLKRTGATGDRAKEGISINTGLLCLGNVISALGDKSKKATHVPYRDSKLTRLLQDSLGGNSRTLMIACISPSDRDFMETLSTLRYANRAKNIRNKVVVNHDSASHTIALLKKENQELRLQIAELKQGKRLIDDDGTEYINDIYHENELLTGENQNLKTKNKVLQETNQRLITRNAEFIAQHESPEIKDIVQKYLMEIEELRFKLLEMEETCSNLRKQNARVSLGRNTNEPDVSSEKIIEDAKREVKKLKAYTKLMNNGCAQTSTSNIQDSCDSNESCDGEDDLLNDSDVEDEELDKANDELNLLNDEISTKEKLIAALEQSQKKHQMLKLHYESKLVQYQNQISEIEKERDVILNKLTQGGNKNDETSKKVHEDYDKKIKALQGNLKKYQDIIKEHSAAMKNLAKNEQQVKKLKNEVCDMKRQKVNIMNKMKEEQSRHRTTELQSTKKIAQLTKQERLKDVKIKNLELENNRMKLALKRKDAEVKALKTRSKILSSNKFSHQSQMSRNKMEQQMNQVIATRQAIWEYDQQMTRDIARRQQLSEDLKMMQQRLREARQFGEEPQLIHELYEDIESINSNIIYLDENIRECQSTILQLQGDDLNTDADLMPDFYSRPTTAHAKARRMTRTPQELLFDSGTGYN